MGILKDNLFLIFVSVMLSTHILINLYLAGWVLRVFAAGSPASRILLGSLAFFTAAFPLGSILARMTPSPIASWLAWSGSWYLGFMAMALLAGMVAHAFLLLAGSHHAGLAGNPKAARIFWACLSLLAIILGAGHWNAMHPVVRSLHIPLGIKGSLRAAMVSDLHVGRMFHNSRVASLMDRINSLDPDLILLVGDVVDGNISEALEQGMVDELQRLRAPLGVFAVTGNHEYYAGKDLAVKTLELGGLRVLQDEAVIIDNRFVLAGRKDRQARRFNESRSSLDEILREKPADLPVVLLDHTPLELEEARNGGIALQLSGHTHRGQMFPFNFITDWIYEEDWGFFRKGDTSYYISCGVGTWGPPVRTSSRPEIVLLEFGEHPEKTPGDPPDVE